MSDTIQTTTLANGLRVITDNVPGMHSAALGIWVGVGTRNENLAQNGVAHMVEHMLFKGTKTRDAQKIVEEIESAGGSMNAYTSREITSYHVHLLAEDAPLGLEVLADMYMNSTLPDDEIEREREVILQEIGMCNDTPDDLVFDVYYETAYPEQSFGAPILGRDHNIKGMTKTHLSDYIKAFYNPANTVISAAGGIDHDKFVAQVEQLFGSVKAAEKAPLLSPEYKGGDLRLEKDLEQSHFVLGFKGLPRTNEKFYAAQTLSTILGSGMSSRLFQEVREKRGLVYSVFSFHSGYRDDGQFAIYAGTGPEKMGEIVPVICDEVLKISDDVSEEELTRAKTQLKAGMLMGRENMMTRADQQAKYTIFRENDFDPQNLIDAIEDVSLSDVKNIAAQIFSRRPTLAALGPLENLEEFSATEARLGGNKKAA